MILRKLLIEESRDGENDDRFEARVRYVAGPTPLVDNDKMWSDDSLSYLCQDASCAATNMFAGGFRTNSLRCWGVLHHAAEA